MDNDRFAIENESCPEDDRATARFLIKLVFGVGVLLGITAGLFIIFGRV